MVCEHCIIKTTWDGTPTGKDITYGPTDVYVAEPASGDKSKAVLFLTDIFGLGLVNNKLLVDDFATAGYYTLAPDLFDKIVLNSEVMQKPGFNFPDFVGQFTPERTWAILEPFIAKLKEEGVKEFAAVGYCFGAKYVHGLAVRHEITAGVVSHPSLIKIPDDLISLKAAGVPVLWNTCETDGAYPKEAQAKGDEILGEGSMEGPNYLRKYYPGVAHGFAVKGDIKKEEVKFAKEDSFKQSIEWLRKHDF